MESANNLGVPAQSKYDVNHTASKKIDKRRIIIANMKHTRNIKDYKITLNGKDLLTRSTGKFYTHHLIGERLARILVEQVNHQLTGELSLIDPFCGDGRLIVHFLQAYHNAYREKSGNIKLLISLWDNDSKAVKHASKSIKSTLKELGLNGDVNCYIGDSFFNDQADKRLFNCVITNPPWETIKPDKRELSVLPTELRGEFIRDIREYDKRLAEKYPFSQPSAKFAGWGTNLSRCGLELSIKLLECDGICGIVLPLSLLTDQTSVRLRQFLLSTNKLIDLAHYPAECRLFEQVDQEAATIIFKKQKPPNVYKVGLSRFDRNTQTVDHSNLSISDKILAEFDYCIPILFGDLLLPMINKWRKFPKVEDLEKDEMNALRLGRELDETDHTSYISAEGTIRFVKGKMIDRYCLFHEQLHFVNETLRSIPSSAYKHRIAWRDVSRRSQARRMIATLIPPNHVTGNSLGIAYFEKEDLLKLRTLLVLFNSIPFEFQMRSRLGTGHISLGVVRKVHIPEIKNRSFMKLLSDTLSLFENGDANAETSLEILAAIAYQLTKLDYKKILNQFNNIPYWYKLQLLYHPAWTSISLKEFSNNHIGCIESEHSISLAQPKIPNHYTAQLSDLDLLVGKSVPPGGNWKNIPESAPSARLVKIRKDYKDGLGSRSTYYGRLLPNKPAYTINTYFSRPGNGCHLHYEPSQNRVISQREAARFQSFPDNFVFLGNRNDINIQIGNAVPPLLAFAIAKSRGVCGQFIDLFCGAGGLGLGFKWAGWRPVVGNDIVQSFLATYARNVHKNIIEGDIGNKEVANMIVAEAKKARRDRPDLPLFVLGGPPCQGFSTAGWRMVDDERNKLFYNFKSILEGVKPDGFLFENVTGLLNIQKGLVFELVKKELSSAVKTVKHWVLSSENYAIPQRRTRVFIMGVSREDVSLAPPPIVTSEGNSLTLFGGEPKLITAYDAISDLPPLVHGEDGSNKDYVMPPHHPYQKFMRGDISADEYLEEIRRDSNI